MQYIADRVHPKSEGRNFKNKEEEKTNSAVKDKYTKLTSFISDMGHNFKKAIGHCSLWTTVPQQDYTWMAGQGKPD